MNFKRFLLATVAVFVFVFFFEWVFHGVLLKDLYQQTSDVWRSKEEIFSYFHYTLLFQFLFSAVVAFLFTRHYEARGIGEGLRYGLYIGLLLAVFEGSLFPYLPIPMNLVCAWMAGGLLKGLGSGVVLALTYRE